MDNRTPLQRDIEEMPTHEMATRYYAYRDELKRRGVGSHSRVEMAGIRGQQAAKRALQIAGIAQCTILLIGPSGCGKTMLRRAALAFDIHASEARPCPCGNYESPLRHCACTLEERAEHEIPWCGIAVECPDIPFEEFMNTVSDTDPLRYGLAIDKGRKILDSGPRPFRLTAQEHLGSFAGEMGLTAKDLTLITRIASAVATLDGDDQIAAGAVNEALIYFTLAQRAVLRLTA